MFKTNNVSGRRGKLCRNNLPPFPHPHSATWRARGWWAGKQCKPVLLQGLQKGAKWLVSFSACSSKLDIRPKRCTAILKSIYICCKVSPVVLAGTCVAGKCLWVDSFVNQMELTLLKPQWPRWGQKLVLDEGQRPRTCKSVILIPKERHGAKLLRLLPEETSNTVRNENVRGNELLGAALLFWSARYFSTCYPSRRVLRERESIRDCSWGEDHKVSDISEACGKRLKKWWGRWGRDDVRWATVKMCRRKMLPGAQCWVMSWPESFGFENCSQSSSSD